MRPVLTPGLRLLWRDEQTVQLGLDPDRARAVAGAGRSLRTVLESMDGARDTAGVVHEAVQRGVDATTAERLLSQLAGWGLVADAGPSPSPDPNARRRELRVEVRGSGRVATGIRSLLTAAGCGWAEAPRASLVVLTDSPVPLAEREGLLREGCVHLVAAVRESTGVVGPLVVPGRTSCLHCHDLHRRDRDRAWPTLLSQLVTAPPVPPDPVLAAAVAAHAVLQALAWWDAVGLGAESGEGIPGTVPDAAELPVLDGTLELSGSGGRLRRRSWTPHPGCGCGWPSARRGLAAG